MPRGRRKWLGLSRWKPLQVRHRDGKANENLGNDDWNTTESKV